MARGRQEGGLGESGTVDVDIRDGESFVESAVPGLATVCVATILDSPCLLRHRFFDSTEDIPAQADR